MMTPGVGEPGSRAKDRRLSKALTQRIQRQHSQAIANCFSFSLGPGAALALEADDDDVFHST